MIRIMAEALVDYSRWQVKGCYEVLDWNLSCGDFFSPPETSLYKGYSLEGITFELTTDGVQGKR